MNRESIFARVRESEAFARRNSPERHARLPKHQTIHKVMLYGFFGVFIGICSLMFFGILAGAVGFGIFGSRMSGTAGAAFSLLPLLFSVVPLLMAGGGVAALIAVRKKMHTLANDPVDALPVIVVDKRTHVSGGGDRMTTTSYYATCEAEDGTRHEYQLWDGNLYGRMAPDDAGILYLRGGYALDFDRADS